MCWKNHNSMKKFFALIIMTLCCCTNCGSNGSQNSTDTTGDDSSAASVEVKLHVIDASRYSVGEIKLSSIAEGKPAQIALGTISDGTLLGSINQIEMSGDYIFILDIQSSSVSMFSNDGTFIRKIGRCGRGPGEFVNLAGMAVDSLQQLVYILSSRKLTCYDFNGKLVKEVPQKGWFSYLKIIDGKLFEQLSQYEQQGNQIITNSYYSILGRDMEEVDRVDFASITVPSGRPMIMSLYNDFISAADGGYYVYNAIPVVSEKRRDTLYRMMFSQDIQSSSSDNSRGGLSTITLAPEFVVKFDSSKYSERSFRVESVFRSNRYLFANFCDAGSYLLCYDLKMNTFQVGKQWITDDICNTGECKIRPLGPDTYWFADYPDTDKPVNPILYIGSLKH